MILAVDIGGTFFRYKFKDFFEKKETKDIDIISEIINLIKKYKPKSIGISFAGQVNKGKILSAPNINIENIDLNKYIKIPFILENDLNCAAVAESRFWKSKYLVALYSGTGLGAGIIENGKLIRGHMNLAGEIGHIPYKKTPFVCECGKDDCLEFYASGKIDSIGGSFEEYKKALNKAVGIVASLFNPEIIVLGGGYYLHHKFKINKKYIPNFDKVEIKITKLKDASLTGAEILAKEKL